MRRAAALSLAVGLWLSALLLGATPAWAHASMTGSDPGQGARLGALPDQVTFEFSEDMDPVAYVVVTAPDGSSVADGDPVVVGSTITQALEGTGADGGYLMAVKAVSADGHAVTGRVEFVVGEGELPSSDQPSDQPSTGSTSTSVTEAPTEPVSAAPAAGASAGRPWWVWAVGPTCLAASLVLWVAARGVPRPRDPRA